MSEPRDHHFIPVFYLKRWANADGKLIEYSRLYRGRFVAKPVGPRGTGFQRDLYAFGACPPELAQYLESVFLNRSDALASLALAKLLSGDEQPWTPQLRSAWSRFAINFLIRHPDPFAEIRAVTDAHWLQPDGITQQEYERLRQPEDPALFEQWVLAQGNNLADKIRMRLIQAALDNEVVGARFNAMAWNVLDLKDSGLALLTSDWPLYKEINGQRMLFTLPISPTALFVSVSHGDIFERLRRMPPEALVKAINKSVVSCARLYVYGTDRSQEQFISNRMSSTPVEPPFFPSLARGR